MNEAPIAVIAAMQPEMDDLLAHLRDARTEYAGSVRLDSGTLEGRRVVLALSGIGKVNAAMTAALVVERFRPRAVINTGSAGGLGAGVRVGDVVIGTETAHHDVDVTAFGYVHGQVPQLPARYAADASLADLAERAAGAFHGAAVRRGLIVSGDQFVSSAASLQAIRHNFPDVEAVEMEAAAIAQVCHQQNTPFVVIRAVSDNGDENAAVSFDAFLQTAGRHSAQMVRAMVAAA